MKHFALAIVNLEQLRLFLESKEIIDEASKAKCTLVQIYTDVLDKKGITEYVNLVKIKFPGCTIIGASSAGGIADGHLFLRNTIISFSFFESSRLIPVIHKCKAGVETDAGSSLAKYFTQIPDIRTILLLASPMSVNLALLLKGMNDHTQGIPIIGGGAESTKSHPAIIFLDDQFSNEGDIIAVGLAGEELSLKVIPLTGWKPLGPMLKLTDVEGFDILKINDIPAFDVYSKYFGLHSGDDLFLLEFPILIKRNGVTLARNPVSSEKDGRISLIADIYKGETARLGYLDVDDVISNVKSTLQTMAAFDPEAIFIFSCICRRFAMQQDVEIETLPFQKIAPVSGFFTYGEFCRISNNLNLLNSSEIVVGIREGECKPCVQVPAGEIQDEVNKYSVRHIRTTSKLFQFISELTNQLEKANESLQVLAHHDPLTGALNRHTLQESIDEEIMHSVRHGHFLSFTLFDIDHFKRINDEFGHPAGDHVLKSIAKAVKNSTRAKDALYRYGGEEFMLILPETPLEGALHVAEKVSKIISSLSLEYEGIPLPTITASFGVACFPDHGKDSKSIISALDKALYHSKEAGRNTVSVAEKV